jgi:hypothetical protein
LVVIILICNVIVLAFGNGLDYNNTCVITDYLCIQIKMNKSNRNVIDRAPINLIIKLN